MSHRLSLEEFIQLQVFKEQVIGSLITKSNNKIQAKFECNAYQNTHSGLESTRVQQSLEKNTDASHQYQATGLAPGEALMSSEIQSTASDASIASGAAGSIEKTFKSLLGIHTIKRSYVKLNYTLQQKLLIHQMKECLENKYNYSEEEALVQLWQMLCPQADFRTFKSNIQIKPKQVKKRGIKSGNCDLDDKIITLAWLLQENVMCFKVSQPFIQFCEEIFQDKYGVKLSNKKSSIERELEHMEYERRAKPTKKILKEVREIYMFKVQKVIEKSKNKKFNKFKCNLY